LGSGQGGGKSQQARPVIRDGGPCIRRSVSRIQDPHPDGDRWQTIGLVGSVLLLVIHTWLEGNSEEDEAVGWIISARKATARERKVYEEGSF
jgi:uncharacterized DUF497 family protein